MKFVAAKNHFQLPKIENSLDKQQHPPFIHYPLHDSHRVYRLVGISFRQKYK